MAHHLLGGLLGVVDEHIQADHRVVAAAEAFEIGGAELDALWAEISRCGPAARLVHHRLGEVAGGDAAGTELGQGKAEAADATAGIEEAAPSQIPLLLQPQQHLIHGFLVADADVPLHLIDLVAVAVDAIPALKARAVEVVADLRFLQSLLQQRFSGHRDRVQPAES